MELARRQQRPPLLIDDVGWNEDVYAAVRLVPAGRVAAYADVAAFLGHPRRPRQVGNALAALDEKTARTVPWHRIVNVAGIISIRGDVCGKDVQRARLLAEGVDVSATWAVVGFSEVRFRFPAPADNESCVLATR